MRYWIDGEDRLSEVDDEWGAFAVENGAPDLASPAILGRPIGSFCSDLTTEGIWRRVLVRARAGATIDVRIRCDAPTLRRLLRLVVSPDGDRVCVRSSPISAEPRPSVALLEVGRQSTAELLGCCSWCKRWRLPTGGWVEVEVLVSALGLFEREVLPGVTHGICEDCRAAYDNGRDGA